MTVFSIAGLKADTSDPQDRLQKRLWNLPLPLLILVPSYLLFILLSISLFDYLTPLDFRILLPIYAACIILLATGASRLTADPGRAASVQKILTGLIIAFIASQILLTYFWYPAQSNLGLNDPAFRESRTMAVVRDLPPETIIYSNQAAYVYYYTGRLAINIPQTQNLNDNRPNASRLNEMLRFQDSTNENSVVLVWFEENPWYVASMDDIKHYVALRSITSDSLGTLYRVIGRNQHP